MEGVVKMLDDKKSIDIRAIRKTINKLSLKIQKLYL